MGECMVCSWLHAHDGQMPAELIERRRADWTPEVSAGAWRRLVGEIARTSGHPASVLVAVEGGGRVIGIGMATLGRGAATVDALYVAPDVQGQGVGSALLGELASVAFRDGAVAVEVVVLAANASARTFYERSGGEVCDTGEFDEEGTLLPTVTYRWPIGRLVDTGVDP